MTTTRDPTTHTNTHVETSFDQLPTLIPGFKYLKDGKTTDGTKDCDCGTISVGMCPFSLDGSVSPFYQSFWGTPTGLATSGSPTDSTPASVSDSSAKSLLIKIKGELNAIPDI